MATSALSSPGTVPAPRRPRLGKDAQEWLAGYAFLTPALIVLILFVFIPILFALVISFTDWTGIQPPNEAHGVGLTNYQQLINPDLTAGEQFYQALRNTVYYVLIVVPLQTIVALLLAIIINQRFLVAKGFFRTGFYLPSITSSVAVAMIFLFLFNRNGIINLALGGIASIFGGEYRPVTWLNDLHGVFSNIYGLFGLTLANAPDWMKTKVLGWRIWDWIAGPSVTWLSIMLLNIWTTSGTMMLIFLAALQDISPSLYEAASVDGATLWQQFRRITVPMLRATTFFVVTIGLIGCFQVFDQVFVISQGGP
ncbi:MAG TPA: sugar ABC transporter permease, partial [Aggregatilineaceae bacterium]|nr:sugar ABC transporter permease [Aggregatilineaceae bacterium]